MSLLLVVVVLCHGHGYGRGCGQGRAQCLWSYRHGNSNLCGYCKDGDGGPRLRKPMVTMLDDT